MNKNIVKIVALFLCYLSAKAQEPIIEPSRPVVNQEFKIILPTARSTTYDWYFKEISKQISTSGLLLPLEPAWVIPYGNPIYKKEAQESQQKNEFKIFTFKALQPGTVDLHFQKKHRYKTGKKVTEAKHVKVVINDR